MKRQQRALVVVAGVLAAAPTSWADTIYVNGACGDDAWTGAVNACSGPDGAKRTIQAAIDAAAEGDVVRVMPGTYTGLLDLSGRQIEISSVNGADLTILDGQGSGPILTCTDVGAAGLIEGFTFTNGLASRGGAIDLDDSEPLIRLCRFEGNHATSEGGAVHGRADHAPTLEECVFVGNTSDSTGGAVKLGSGALVLCVFDGNQSGWGGALRLDGNGTNEPQTFTIDGCHFESNTAQQYGGAINLFANEPFTLEITSSVFRSNDAAVRGGAMYGEGLGDDGTTVTLTGVQIEQNAAEDVGGVAVRWITAAEVIDSTFVSNVAADDVGGLELRSMPTCTVRTTQFIANEAGGEQGGALITSADASAIEGCRFESNVAGSNGGGLVTGGNVTIHECELIGNTATNASGAWISGSGFRMTRCAFIGNTGESAAGLFTGAGIVANCLFEANTATDSAAAMNLNSSSVSVVNSTVRGNVSTASSAAIEVSGTNALTNCLFAANEGGTGALDLLSGATTITNSTFVEPAATAVVTVRSNAQASVENAIVWDGASPFDVIGDFAVLTVAHSCVAGGWAGDGNVAGDPAFMDASGADGDPMTWEDNDYRLSPLSPCVNAGDEALLPADVADLDGDDDTAEALPHDLAGAARVFGASVDVGAFELQEDAAPCAADLDGSGAVGFADLTMLLSQWGTGGAADLDGDGVVGFTDLTMLLAAWGACA